MTCSSSFICLYHNSSNISSSSLICSNHASSSEMPSRVSGPSSKDSSESKSMKAILHGKILLVYTSIPTMLSVDLSSRVWQLVSFLPPSIDFRREPSREYSFRFARTKPPFGYSCEPKEIEPIFYGSGILYTKSPREEYDPFGGAINFLPNRKVRKNITPFLSH